MAYMISSPLHYLVLVLLLAQYSVCTSGETVKEIPPKPIRTTFQDEYGLIFDCFEINSQPSLNHPLLKNHTVQLRRSSYPRDIDKESRRRDDIVEPKISNISCPSGTVPILRNNGAPGSIKSVHNLTIYGDKYLDNKSVQLRKKFAGVFTPRGVFYGTTALLSVHKPDTYGSEGRISGANIKVVNARGTGKDQQSSGIFAGWFVEPSLYGDKEPHLQIAWKDLGDYCVDLRCGGFVQTSSLIRPGMSSQLSGQQTYICLDISKDYDTGNWWLIYGCSTVFENYEVGYWPNSLFTHMREYATDVHWYGLVSARTGDDSSSRKLPPMGSGTLGSKPFDSPRPASFIEARVYNALGHQLPPNAPYSQMSDQKCYDVGNPLLVGTTAGLQFTYGGPGCTV